MFIQIIALPDATATHQFGVKLGQGLPAGTVLLLQGNLGAGKTTFVQGLAEGLGITEAVVSPTFILLSEYPEGRVPLYHFDLYRLETAAAVQDLQVESYWEGLEVEPGIVAIEWAERLPILPPSYWRLTFAWADPSPESSGRGRVLHCQAIGQVDPKNLSAFRDLE